MKFTIACAACIIAGALSTGLHAQYPVQPAPAPATGKSHLLAQALQSAWERAVGAREAGAFRERAQAEQAAAGRLWARSPVIEVNHRDDRWQSAAGQRESEFGLAIPIWLPGQRAATQAAADMQVEESAAAERAALLRLAGEVRESAWNTVAVTGTRNQAKDQLALLERLAEDVDRRVAAGDLARADALAARAEVLAARAQWAEAQQQQHAATTRWTQLTGMNGPPDPDRLLEPAAAVDGLARDHPELQWLAFRTAHARRRLELVRHSDRDSPEIKVGVRHDVPGGPVPAQNSLLLGIRVPLGTADRNRPLVAAASGELDVALTSEMRSRERIAADMRVASFAVEIAEDQFASATRRAEMLGERAALIERSFKAGETALPELLRSLAVASEAARAAARQQASRGLARARLRQALGVSP